MKKQWKQILIAGSLIICGLLLMAYPFISNYLYENRQEEIIYGYQETAQKTDDSEVEDMLAQAQEYNTWLSEREVVLTDPFDPEKVRDKGNRNYEKLLNPDNDGVMGYIEIPKIKVFLPIYHGTSEEVLKNGVGHLENTSLPVGGESTHSVLSAHTGLSDKKLFTDLVLLEEGDTFLIKVLNQTLAYQVDQILTVLPDDTSALRIVQGEDYVTLVTCTPYGVNSHRLLVRGHRIPYEPEQESAAEQPKESSPWMHQYLLAVGTGTGLLLLLVLFTIIIGRRRK